MCGPEVDVDGVKDAEEREAPGDAVNDDLLAVGEELIDNRPQEENVYHRPALRECV